MIRVSIYCFLTGIRVCAGWGLPPPWLNRVKITGYIVVIRVVRVVKNCRIGHKSVTFSQMCFFIKHRDIHTLSIAKPLAEMGGTPPTP